MTLTYREYLDYAERCLLNTMNEEPKSDWYLIPACILAWSAVESFVNNMLDDFASLEPNTFDLHERAFLLEKRLLFVNYGLDIGKFILEGKEYRKLEDKIFFLIARSGGRDLKNVKGETLWQQFEHFKEIRDALVHPRRDKDIHLKQEIVEEFIHISKQIIKLISKKVWKREVTL
jgi:hypothetical protein